MQQGDYGNQGSGPWALRKRGVPLRTYSGEIKYKPAPSRRHFWKAEDVERILAKIIPPEDAEEHSWTLNLIEVIKRSTLAMMERLLFFLDSRAVETIYNWGIDILDKVFQVPDRTDQENEVTARRIILYIADRAGLTVTISK